MAFLNRVTSLVKNTVSKNVTSELFAPSLSPFQAIRSFSSSKLFVGGVSYTTDEASLREEFSKYGEVTEAPYHTLRARASHFPVHSKYVPFMRYELFSSTASTAESGGGNKENQKINVTFVDKDGEEAQIKVPVGMSMLEAAHENDLDLEGACEGSLACSTCHVIVMDVEQYNKLPDPTDEENDMLDLAFGLTETSRLGCQIIAEPELEGLRLAIPSATRNFAVDGFKPKPH